MSDKLQFVVDPISLRALKRIGSIVENGIFLPKVNDKLKFVGHRVRLGIHYGARFDLLCSFDNYGLAGFQSIFDNPH